MAKVGQEEYGRIKAREEENRIRTVASRILAKVEANLGETKHMTRKRHGRASEARTGKHQAREGRDRIMPKKDMTEIDKV